MRTVLGEIAFYSQDWSKIHDRRVLQLISGLMDLDHTRRLTAEEVRAICIPIDRSTFINLSIYVYLSLSLSLSLSIYLSIYLSLYLSLSDSIPGVEAPVDHRPSQTFGQHPIVVVVVVVVTAIKGTKFGQLNRCDHAWRSPFLFFFFFFLFFFLFFFFFFFVQGWQPGGDSRARSG